jgi:hypothetical protein
MPSSPNSGRLSFDDKEKVIKVSCRVRFIILSSSNDCLVVFQPIEDSSPPGQKRETRDDISLVLKRPQSTSSIMMRNLLKRTTYERENDELKNALSTLPNVNEGSNGFRMRNRWWQSLFEEFSRPPSGSLSPADDSNLSTKTHHSSFRSLNATRETEVADQQNRVDILQQNIDSLEEQNEELLVSDITTCIHVHVHVTSPRFVVKILFERDGRELWRRKDRLFVISLMKFERH